MVKYSNGKMAWDGRKGSMVKHSNGKMAWDGRKGSMVKHSNGELLTLSDDGCEVDLGEDMSLRVSTSGATLVVLGTSIDIDG
jgi:hypothetical protein